MINIDNSYDKSLKSITNYIEQKININAKKQTKNKYLIFIYGPPASGKTIARKIIFKFIQNYIEWNNNLDVAKEIESSIDTRIDDLIYARKYKNENINIKNKLKEILNDKPFKNFCSDLNNISDSYEENENTKEIVNLSDDVDKITNNKEASDIYFYGKNDAYILSELLKYYASLYKKNIIVEIISPDKNYIKPLAKMLCLHYDYFPIFIYPYVDDKKILWERSIKRGCEEGRFVSLNLINSKYDECKKGYDEIKEIFKRFKNYLCIKYDNNLDTDTFNNLDKKNIFDLKTIKIIDICFSFQTK